ncbi:hypothetical protein HOY82DRAFT_611141 [Tuber indicum]|nr:hypothetical protein HOY82DRAFT_611141 [Tuber indicum]
MSRLAGVVLDLAETVTGLNVHTERRDRRTEALEDLVDSLHWQALGTKADKRPAVSSSAPAVPVSALLHAPALTNAPKGPKAAKPKIANKFTGRPLKPADTPPPGCHQGL